tara:strand:- start:3754 stop:4026 length:273 start_codon:yes stop_codon:yes gene_type:complete
MIFKKKIKEQPKRYPYRNNVTSNYSAWDNLSIIEKFALITMPMMLTCIDYFITEALFGLGPGITWTIAIVSTIVLMVIVWYIAKWLTDEY